jgi:serine/threonine protein kinase
MLAGDPPFYSDDLKQLFSNIRNEKLKFPRVIKSNAKSLLTAVLNRDPRARPTIQQIKDHPFFKTINWNTMMAKQYRPPRLGKGWP